MESIALWQQSRQARAVLARPVLVRQAEGVEVRRLAIARERTAQQRREAKVAQVLVRGRALGEGTELLYALNKAARLLKACHHVVVRVRPVGSYRARTAYRARMTRQSGR